MRDNLPHVIDSGKLSLFGGAREPNESFLECVVREVHEEIGLYLAPQRFELIARYSGPDYLAPHRALYGEIFLARNVPIENLTVSEGTLRVVKLDELERLNHCLSLPAKYALEIALEKGHLSMGRIGCK